MTYSEAGRSALRDLVASLDRAEADVRSEQTEGVHELRVITRRLRAVLAGFRDCFDERCVADVRDRLKLFGSVLGTARDLEVRAATADALLTDVQERMQVDEARERLVGGALSQFATAREKVVDYLDGAAYRELRTRLRGLAGAEARAPEHSLGGLIRHELRRTGKRITAADSREPGSLGELGALHEARKASRRLRYLGEAIAATVPGSSKRFSAVAAKAETVQDALGDHRDGALFAEFLLFESHRAHAAGEDTFALGVVHEISDRSSADARTIATGAMGKLKRERRRW
jgi:CHAD domain-containing protein